MSSKKISKDDALIIENGVLFSRATATAYLCGNSSHVYRALMKLEGEASRKAFWEMLHTLFRVDRKISCAVRACDFVKITNIYNSPFIYVKQESGHVNIIPFNEEVVILEDEMSDYFKEFFEKRDIYYDD